VAEKYLKAILQEYGIKIPKTHSFAELVALALEQDSDFIQIQADLNVMEGFAVHFRYPGLTADKEEAGTAMEATRRVRLFIRNKLEL
jgi:HEPN domain-containing protein